MSGRGRCEAADRPYVMPQEASPVAKVFGDFDITDFWEASEYATKEYVA